MKAAFLLGLLVLAVLVQDSEAGFFRRLGRRIKEGVRRGAGAVRDGVRRAGGAIRDRVREGIRRAGERLRDRIVRGKRSAVGWKNQLGDINTVDIAKTFNLDLPLVEEMFIVADADKSGALDGQEVLVFIGLIETTVGSSGGQISTQ